MENENPTQTGTSGETPESLTDEQKEAKRKAEEAKRKAENPSTPEQK